MQANQVSENTEVLLTADTLRQDFPNHKKRTQSSDYTGDKVLATIARDC